MSMPAPPLQFALNLLDLCYVAGMEYESSVEDYKQHVNKGVGRDVCQFSEHVPPPSSD